MGCWHAHGVGSTCPWGSLDSGSTVSILAPQELFLPLHFCSEIVTQILLEPLSILPRPGGYPGMMRPVAATLVQAVLVWCQLCHGFSAVRAGCLVPAVPEFWYWPCRGFLLAMLSICRELCRCSGQLRKFLLQCRKCRGEKLRSPPASPSPPRVADRSHRGSCHLSR